MDKGVLYPGLSELLERILRMGWRACLVTGKPSVYARQIMDFLN